MCFSPVEQDQCYDLSWIGWVINIALTTPTLDLLIPLTQQLHCRHPSLSPEWLVPVPWALPSQSFCTEFSWQLSFRSAVLCELTPSCQIIHRNRIFQKIYYNRIFSLRLVSVQPEFVSEVICHIGLGAPKKVFGDNIGTVFLRPFLLPNQ